MDPNRWNYTIEVHVHNNLPNIIKNLLCDDPQVDNNNVYIRS